MLLAVRCNEPSFQTVRFEPGFNVVLAERTQESTKRDSRNGLGKTTLIEIIHFCLGSSPKKGTGLLSESLADWTFALDLSLRGRSITVQRNTSRPRIVLVQGNTSGWPIQPHITKADPSPHYIIQDWTTVLGWLMFNLDPELNTQRYTPTFRSLISYFVRRGRDAYSIPFEHHRKQLEWDKQVNNAYLLGLWWEYAQRSQVIRDKEINLRLLRDVARAGLVPNLMGTIGSLEAEKIQIEATIRQEAAHLANFRVHEQYRHIEQRASRITAEIHQLTNDNVSDRRTIEFYESSFHSERPSNPDLVNQMYGEARIVLPDSVVKRLDEVHTFHQQVVANREGFLRDEIDRLNKRISDHEEEIRRLDDERADLLAILQTYGALEEYTLLQQRHTQAVARLQEIQARIDNLTKYEQEKIELRIEQERLQLAARNDYDERRPIRERAVSLFNTNSEALYEAPGKLIIDIAATGYKFQVEIERSLSQGIEQMKVFCYDLMLAQLWTTNQVKPGFLLHDSTIFDGVDERQIAHAIETAATSADRNGFQYICCLNSDLIPWEDFETINLRDYIRLELTDATEAGSLLGIRF